MRDYFPCRGYSKFIMVMMVPLIILGICCLDHENIKAFLPQNGVALAEGTENYDESSIIEDINVAEKGNVNIITIKASNQLTYAVVKLKEPLRIVVDIPKFETEGTIETLEINGEVIKNVTNKKIEKGEKKFCRVEIGLNKDAEYEVTSDGKNLIIRVAGTSELVAIAKKTEKEEKTEEKLESTGVKKITDLEINKELDGLTVTSDSEISNYNAFILNNPNRLVVDIHDVKNNLSKNIFPLKSHFVDKLKVGQHEGKVRIVVCFKGNLPNYHIEKSNNKLDVLWQMPALVAKEEIKAEAVPVKEEKVEEIKAEAVPVKDEKVEKVVEEAKEISEKPEEVVTVRRDPVKPKYTGQKISLDFKDADIRNILRLIADISDLNIIVSDNVSGKVTVKLDNVPWDQVLDIILETNSLGKIWMDSVLRIETQDEIKKISDKRYQAQKSQEKVADLKTEVVDIIYRDAKDVLKLLEEEKEITSDRGALSVDPNLNRIIITDTPEKVAKIKGKIMRYDDRTVRQVYIEARIVQSIPTFTKEIGISWGGLGTATKGKSIYGVGGAGGVEFEQEEQTNPVTGLPEIITNVIGQGNVIDLPAAAGAGTGGGIGFGILRRNFELTATLTAMEKDEKLKIISNPRVLSLDKNEAMIKQGVALPYLKLSEEGVTSTDFKDAVLELRVTPTILSERIIKIELNVKKDQKSAQTGAGGEPGIDVREAKSVLMVESGRTVVIGGIYEETTTIIKSGVPFFSDIPGLGKLFRNDFNKKELTELLIFLTTTIVPKDIIGGEG